MVILNVIVWGSIFAFVIFVHRVQIRHRVRRWFKMNIIMHNWGQYKNLWAGIKRNPASFLLCIASFFIAVALWVFGFDIYELYVELHKQIDEGGKTPEEYRGIAIRYFGIVAGAGAIIGYIIAIARNITANNQNKVADEQNRINERGRITESMVQAIAQIGTFNDGKPNIEVRLGGLYSLQRIMQDSPRDEQTIAKIFYAYVRENAKRDIANKKTPPMREDVQTALDIIGQFYRGEEKFDEYITFDICINFARVNLGGYSIPSIDFSFAILEDVGLSGLELSSRVFFNTNLRRADLSFASLLDTNLTGANLTGADLSFANLSGADLSNANLSNANLSGVFGLTQKQINEAYGDKHTNLPQGLAHPALWMEEDRYEGPEEER